eukprot:Skav222072  [mRNA]  locus=scaffold4586:22555:23689:- [translate_table: standard]
MSRIAYSATDTDGRCNYIPTSQAIGQPTQSSSTSQPIPLTQQVGLLHLIDEPWRTEAWSQPDGENVAGWPPQEARL